MIPRRGSLYALSAIIAGTVLCAPPGQAQTLAGGKGVSLTPLTRVKPTVDGYAYDPPPGIGTTLFRTIRDSGVDLVRLVVRPMPMLSGTSAAREKARNQVIAMTRALNAAGIATIVDIHPWTPDTLADEAALVCATSGSAGLAQMLVALAEALRLEPPGKVALELLNEPKRCKIRGQIRWPVLQQQLVKQVRSVAPKLPIIVTGGGGQANDLLGLDVTPYAADSNIYFSFHFYEPFIFTTPGYFNAHNVPFPPAGTIPEGLRGSMSYNFADMNLQQSRDFVSYLTHPFGAVEIANRFAGLTEWRKARDISADRIVLGEYGIVRNATEDSSEGRRDELRWLSLVTAAASRNGFKRVLWSWPIRAHYDYDSNTRMIRRDVAAAAGLVLPKPPQ